MEDQNSGSNVNRPSEKVTGAKIWNSLCRYFYQKISPSQLLAIAIIIGLCANDQEAVGAYTVLDPQNDYMPELVPFGDNNPSSDQPSVPDQPNVYGNVSEKLMKLGGFCYKLITPEKILFVLQKTGWGAKYIDAVTEIVERRRIRNQNTQGSADPNPTDDDDGNKKLLTDPVTEYEIAKEILIYLHEKVPSEDILTLLKTTRWGKNYVGPIADFIQMYQSQNPSASG